MEFELIKRAAPLLEPALRAIVLTLIFLGSLASAQSVQLTPEQQMMLNQLPPAQREQALQVLRQQSAGVQSVGQPVRETAETPSADLSPDVAAEPKGETQRAGANSTLLLISRRKSHCQSASSKTWLYRWRKRMSTGATIGS